MICIPTHRPEEKPEGDLEATVQAFIKRHDKWIKRYAKRRGGWYCFRIAVEDAYLNVQVSEKFPHIVVFSVGDKT